MRDVNSPSSDQDAATSDSTEATTVGEPGAVQVIVGTDRTRIVLSGEVDADLGPELQEATAEAEQRGLPIEVDAHHVTFMDSSGVAFLARLSIRSEHRVRLLRVPPTVRFLLEVTRIGELLDVVDDDGAAPFEPVDSPG
ncbi:STAS domain-containing protein [Cellulomonas dongxiuzhuiae]|uniref:STAS domain-containing protein n=1 Tax=Cellulomonas dongxiuzhuiae TaxID=2819979 RepID=A0ABX8GHZ7_9CELL|nr:STAS domain-containing protein [Cellulomonas dongxiuzhuiae]MBO3088133.1 STAS domain-containing protein [Cellulomonas dongxiuzhuiae]MBO3094520.1 STAS domain-containing protein [Cellulomonas dongxiuzhuiae]QWC15543.1 STAS domain-containing protein [Cellulomonas dongxiuzhuiae]